MSQTVTVALPIFTRH